MRRPITQAMIAAVVLTGLAACQPQTIVLPDDQAQAFAAEVDEIVENALVGLSTNDYERHVRDFDEEMLRVTDPVTFPQLYDQVIGVVGAYQSRTLLQVEDQGDFRIVTYSAVFANDPNVTVRFVFARDDPEHHISGMWFDSQKLREAQQDQR
jgi:hypothetical protein